VCTERTTTPFVVIGAEHDRWSRRPKTSPPPPATRGPGTSTLKPLQLGDICGEALDEVAGAAE
jgi:hypothetical protein